ncbi:hypothetical protein FRC01_002746, partial [Tulasnella sp. 417]
MVSGNDDMLPTVGSEEAESHPPGYEGSAGQPPYIREGLYILTTKKSRSTLDLWR